MINCLACKQPVAEKDGKLFAECFVCPGCYQLATHLYERGERDVRWLLVMLKEALRIAILKGELRLTEDAQGEVSKQQLLSAVAGLAEKAQEKKHDPAPR